MRNSLLITSSLLLCGIVWLNVANAQLLSDPQVTENSRLALNSQNDEASTFDSLTDTEKFQQELEYWKSNALKGDADAQFKVGVLYTNEQYSEPNFVQAIHWYTLASEQNHPLAQYNLGHHYLNGIGVAKNVESAMHLWLKAAQQDHPSAQFNVGRAYYFGIGLPTDLTQARLWFEKAAANNEEKSTELLKQVKWDELTSSENEPSNDIAPSSKHVIASEQTAASNTPKKLAVTLYTDPAVNHYPIINVENSSKLEVIKQSDEWTSVKYSDSFPVWVHADFVTVTGSKALVTSNNIDTRSEPTIIHGNIVGKLKQGEILQLLDSLENWHQVIAPSYFQAWVKTSQLSLSTYIEKLAQADNNVNDNEWLFEQNPEHYTVQLTSLSETDDIDEFLTASNLKGDDNTRQFHSKKAESIWTQFFYGAYRKKADAIKAKLGIVKKGAHVKSFAKIQQSRCVNWKKQLPPPTELNTYCSASQ